jgi:hypothetical protein
VTEGDMPVTLLQACAHNSETPASGHITKYRFIKLEKMSLMIQYFFFLANLMYVNYKIGDVISYGLVNVFQTTWIHILKCCNFKSVLKGPDDDSTLRITVTGLVHWPVL